MYTKTLDWTKQKKRHFSKDPDNNFVPELFQRSGGKQILRHNLEIHLEVARSSEKKRDLDTKSKQEVTNSFNK